jgi:hypothetical protein
MSRAIAEREARIKSLADDNAALRQRLAELTSMLDASTRPAHADGGPAADVPPPAEGHARRPRRG